MCDSGAYISPLNLCDGKFDCPGKDIAHEKSCICSVTEEGKNKFCKYIKEDNKTRCFFLYHSTFYGSCEKYSLFLNIREKDTNNIHATSHKKSFVCNNGLEIDERLFNDLIPDCGNTSEDKPQLFLLN